MRATATLLLLGSAVLSSPGDGPLPLESFVRYADVIVVVAPVTRPKTYKDTFTVRVESVLKGKDVPRTLDLDCFPPPPLVPDTVPPVHAQWERTLVYLCRPSKKRPGIWTPMIFDELAGRKTLAYRGYRSLPVADYLETIRYLARLQEQPALAPRLWLDGLGSRNPLLVACLLERFAFRPSPHSDRVCSCGQGPGDIFGREVAAALHAKRKDLVDAVYRLTAHQDAAIRGRAARAVDELPGWFEGADARTRALKRLRALLEDHDDAVAAAAAGCLGWRKDDAARKHAIRWLRERRRQSAALDALYEFQTNRQDLRPTVPHLVACLNHPSLQSRAALLLAWATDNRLRTPEQWHEWWREHQGEYED